MPENPFTRQQFAALRSEFRNAFRQYRYALAASGQWEKLPRVCYQAAVAYFCVLAIYILLPLANGE